MAIRMEVKIGALTLRDREVEQLEIAQSLGDHHRLSLTFHRDPSKPLQLGDFVAPAVTVSLTDDVAKITVKAFAGVGTSCEEQHQLHGGSRFVLTALSASEKYSRRHHVGRFPAAAFGDVVGHFEGVSIGAAPTVDRPANYVQSGEVTCRFWCASPTTISASSAQRKTGSSFATDSTTSGTRSRSARICNP